MLGEEIAEKDRANFGGSTHFRLEIDMVDQNTDRCFGTRCPICGYIESKGGKWADEFCEEVRKALGGGDSNAERTGATTQDGDYISGELLESKTKH